MWECACNRAHAWEPCRTIYNIYRDQTYLGQSWRWDQRVKGTEDEGTPWETGVQLVETEQGQRAPERSPTGASPLAVCEDERSRYV